MRAAYVYTFWRGSEPLYVGCTVNLQSRMRDHQKWTQLHQDATWIAWVKFDDHKEALEAENRRIQKLRPVHNVIYNSRRRKAHDLQDTALWLDFGIPYLPEHHKTLAYEAMLNRRGLAS